MIRHIIPTGTARQGPEVRAGGSRRYAPPADAALALADGRIFRGRAFGARSNAEGEVVFTTTMVGYQEVCTDPSFRGQIVCMTYPLIGNYGIQPDQDESRNPWIAGLVVREHCLEPSHAQSEGRLDDYLRQYRIPGISDVDTRALTRHIREVGDIRAVLVHDAAAIPDDELTERARSAPLPGERDVVGEVSVSEVDLFGDSTGTHIVVIDCGVKNNIIRSLVRRGAHVTVVPFGISFSELQQLHPDGVIVSPGPGDPANLDSGLKLISEHHGTPDSIFRHLPGAPVAGTVNRRNDT